MTITKGETTKSAILDEATDLASRVGLGGLTIGSLATATGMSKSGLYAHFASKEALQLDVLDRARARYVDVVVRPALSAPRGEPRLTVLVERSLAWQRGTLEGSFSGGCVIVAAGNEFDDQPGAVRDEVVRAEHDRWDTMATAIRMAVSEGHLRADLDVGQLVFDLQALLLGYHRAVRLLRDTDAETRARASYTHLLAAARSRS